MGGSGWLGLGGGGVGGWVEPTAVWFVFAVHGAGRRFEADLTFGNAGRERVLPHRWREADSRGSNSSCLGAVLWVGATLTQPSPASGRGLLARRMRLLGVGMVSRGSRLTMTTFGIGAERVAWVELGYADVLPAVN